MTFKEAEAAKKACEDATPIINGRRANCNLASLGARRPRSTASTTPPQQQGIYIYIFDSFGNGIIVNATIMGGRGVCNVCVNVHDEGSNGGPRPTSAAPANQMQWYYPAAAGTPPSPFHHQHHQPVPFYGYVYAPC